MSMIFLVILVAFSEVVVKLYLYYLHSLLVWGALKKYHSKSYIKKSKKNRSLSQRFSGEYIDYDVYHKERWLKPSIRIININLLDIVIVVVASSLTITSILSMDVFHELCAILSIKDAVLVICMIAIYKKRIKIS